MLKLLFYSNPQLHLTAPFFLPEYEQGHLPKLTEFNSVLDLFTLCNLMILANVLDLRTHQPPLMTPQSRAVDVWEKHDVNMVPAIERYEIAHARGRCWDILRWFFSAYEIFDKGVGEPINGFDHVAMAYLSHQASAILEFKKRALKSLLDNGKQVSLKSLERQIKLCLRSYGEIPPIPVASPAIDGELSLAFPEAQKYGVRKLATPRFYERKFESY